MFKERIERSIIEESFGKMLGAGLAGAAGLYALHSFSDGVQHTMDDAANAAKGGFKSFWNHHIDKLRIGGDGQHPVNDSAHVDPHNTEIVKSQVVAASKPQDISAHKISGHRVISRSTNDLLNAKLQNLKK